MGVTVFMDDGYFSYLSIVNQCSGMPVVTDVSAEDYLRFAKSDLDAGTKHGLINAMGNAKRSLHLMIDTILQNYGLLAYGRRRSFPGKLRLMDDVGLIALNVFRKLNVGRNIMEHEYQSPDPELVQDFVDVCNLLLLAIERLGQDLPYRSIVGLRETGEHMYLVVEPMLGRLDFRPLLAPTVNVTEVFGSEVEYVSTIFREGDRVPDAKAVGDVVRSIELRPSNEAQWIPIVRLLVEIGNDRSDYRVTRVDDGWATVWSSISFPVEGAHGKALAELIGELNSKGIQAADKSGHSQKAD
ncbi:hypothetical protein [Nocardia asiatica]|uniref:hypothetical protein n=1 Tax=Nocardia asiatica TaxID=209252 RepID=UPI003EE3A286